MSEVLISILWVSFIFQSLKEISEHYELFEGTGIRQRGEICFLYFIKNRSLPDLGPMGARQIMTSILWPELKFAWILKQFCLVRF